MSNSATIIRLYKSRRNILDILDLLDYNIADYDGFSINEIDAMYVNSQLDLLLTHNTNGKKVYVKYFTTSKQIRPANLEQIIEDLYVIDQVLTKNDTMIIITEDEPNDTITTNLKYLYDHDGIFVVIHNISRLQFNILEHRLVPSTVILKPESVAEMMQKYNLKDKSQLPEISRFDPMALALCMRPGDVCKIERKSSTALLSDYYRVCI
jgi:DNA-directed RNA polymerase subunit H